MDGGGQGFYGGHKRPRASVARAGALTLGACFVWLASCGESTHGSGPKPGHVAAGRAGAAGRASGGATGAGAAGKAGAGIAGSRGGRGGIEGPGQAGENGSISGAPGAAGATNHGAGGEGGVATNGGGATSDAGQSGAGGAAPSSCHSTRATTPVLPASTALDPDQVAIAAAVIGSCWPDDGVNRNATHLWHANLAADRLYYRIASELSCVVNADCGCDAVEHCFGYEVGPSTSCTQGCDGAHFTGCGAGVGLPNGYRASFDCDSVGLACDPTAICSEGSATTCVASTFVADCTAEGRPEYCEDGVVWHGQACGDFGLACADGGCVGTGADCGSGSSYPYDEVIDFEGVGCSGDVLDACVADKRATLDCTTQGPGFSCQTHDGTFFCGLASECVPATDGSDSALAASCNGSVLTFCNAGRIEQIDCTTLGFTGCDIDTSIGHYGCVSQ